LADEYEYALVTLLYRITYKFIICHFPILLFIRPTDLPHALAIVPSRWAYDRL